MTSKEGKQKTGFDMAKIKEKIEKKLKGGTIQDYETERYVATDISASDKLAQILEPRAPAKHMAETMRKKNVAKVEKYVVTGVSGFDNLFEYGIPKGSNVIIAGGPGSGKTIFCLQMLAHHASLGKKCFYMSFEESEEKLIEHMKDFGWNPENLINSDNLKIKKYLSSGIHYLDRADSIEAMFAKEEDSQLIELEPISLQLGFKLDFIVLDSLTAIASAFEEKEQSYRFYVERLFDFFKNLGSTNFLITETRMIPEVFSPTGTEEFLADGVIVLYNIRRENIRESAIEVLKMRGAKHQRKIVAMQITDEGIVVYPEQEVFGGIE